MEVVGYWFQDRYSLNLCFMTNGSRGKSRFLKSARFAWGGGGRSDFNLLNIPTADSGQDKQCKMSISIDRDWETLHMPETLHIHLHILG